MLKKDSIENYLKMDTIMLETTISIINSYFTNMNNYIYKVDSTDDLMGMLLALSEVYPYLQNKEYADELSYYIMKKVRNLVEEGKYYSISFYEGLGHIAFCVNEMCQKSGHYQKFRDSINAIYTEQVMERLLYQINNKDKMTTAYYDAIDGIAGVCQYLLLYDDCSMEKLLKKCLNYLVDLCKTISVSDMNVPGWYITEVNQMGITYRNMFSKGSINYSLSHGCAGILAVLSLAYSKGIRVKNQESAIEYIINEYSNKIYIDMIACKFPTILPLEDYNMNGLIEEKKNMSWCYGIPGILWSIFLAGNAMKKQEWIQWSLKNFNFICRTRNVSRFFDSPIICHGYAGIACILEEVYKYNENEEVKNTILSLTNNIIFCYNEHFLYGFRDYEKMKLHSEFYNGTDKNSFLEGASGVVIELISLITGASSWKKLLLLN